MGIDYHVINITKKRSPSDRFGIFWGKVEIPEYDEEKAKEKFDDNERNEEADRWIRES